MYTYNLYILTVALKDRDIFIVILSIRRYKETRSQEMNIKTTATMTIQSI